MAWSQCFRISLLFNEQRLFTVELLKANLLASTVVLPEKLEPGEGVLELGTADEKRRIPGKSMQDDLQVDDENDDDELKFTNWTSYWKSGRFLHAGDLQRTLKFIYWFQAMPNNLKNLTRHIDRNASCALRRTHRTPTRRRAGNFDSDAPKERKKRKERRRVSHEAKLESKLAPPDDECGDIGALALGVRSGDGDPKASAVGQGGQSSTQEKPQEHHNLGAVKPGPEPDDEEAGGRVARSAQVLRYF
ncbi:hypothetical protein K438DRAFT_1930533 [Mycena galopus ATCC 62051]|nr:hypothetical protein K438DRAFT_1930533 [Mycena galopus ATCC 62051]